MKPAGGQSADLQKLDPEALTSIYVGTGERKRR
jgi:hypothetical protein